MLHGHGDDAYRCGWPVRVNFSGNVRPGGPPAGLREHLFARFDTIATYPEATAESLTALLARREQVPTENVLVTAGATAAIHLIAQAFRARRSGIVVPTFAEYEDAAAVNDHRLDFTGWPALAAGRLPPAGDLLWLCNPNNPTGAVLARDELLELAAARPETTFVVDQSYADLCAEPPLLSRDCEIRPNLLLVRSLTKAFAIPGLRLGFVTGGRETLQSIRRFVVPWAVSAPALAAGEFLLADGRAPAPPIAEYLAESREFQRALGAVEGVTVTPSATGFFLARLGRGSAAELKAHLLQTHGFLIRDAANFRGLDAAGVRLATQRPEQNRALVEAIRRWMHS